jgi:hypothetical protein
MEMLTRQHCGVQHHSKEASDLGLAYPEAEKKLQQFARFHPYCWKEFFW